MSRTTPPLFAVRVVLPCTLLIAGVALVFIRDTAPLGIALLVIAALVSLADWLMRLSLQSQHDRDNEQRARDRMALTGRWPDEGPRR